MNWTEFKLLQKARAGSRLREKQAEALHANDLIALMNHHGKLMAFVEEAKRMNHVVVPERIIIKDSEKEEEEVEIVKEEPKRGLLSWLF
mgnify:CR=1 FL=1|tara:strand:- start:279 stop:545 length:267 start_codon:yes stop_codon:yes gene_type:complete